VALPAITDGQIALDPVNRIFYYLDSNGVLVNSSLNLLQASDTSIVTEENLTVNNITVLGNTTVIDSTVTTIKDPIMTLGGTTAPTLDDNKDRGIEFRWHDGTSAKVGFFGFDDSSGKFTFIPDATNASEVFSGSIGEIAAKINWDNILNKPTFVNSITGTANEINVDASTGNVIISLPATAALNISGTAAGWTTPRRITLAGDLDGNVIIDGGSDVTLTANIVSDSVTLGTDTTGNYVASLIAGTDITIVDGTGEQSQPIIGVTPNSYDVYGSASTAQTNAAADASTKATTAYNNAVTYIDNQLSSFDINDLSDVTITSVDTNQFLKYNGTNWINDSLDLSDFTDTFEVTSPTSNQALLWDSTQNRWMNKVLPELITGTSFTHIIGNGTDTTIPVTHSLNSANVVVSVTKLDVATNKFQVLYVAWQITNSNVVTFFFDTAPAADSVKVSIFASVQSTSVQPSSLAGLVEDVAISGSLNSNQSLFYNGSKWVNRKLSLNTDISNLSISSPVEGQTIKYNGSNWINAEFTKSMVGLGNVDNTADLDKPVSTAVQAALDLKADLNSPTFTGTVSGITKSMVGLGNVANTADLDKPVSTAVQAALDLKADLNSPTFTGTVSGITKSMVGLGSVANTADLDKPVSTAVQAALDLKADLNAVFTTSNFQDASVTTAKIADNAITSAKIADATIDEKTENYTLELTDKNKFVKMSVAGANTVTVPTNASVAWPVGSQIHIIQYGTGKTQVIPVSGTVTIYATPGTYLRARYSSATLLKCDTNTWLLTGDLSDS